MLCLKRKVPGILKTKVLCSSALQSYSLEIFRCQVLAKDSSRDDRVVLKSYFTLIVIMTSVESSARLNVCGMR